MKHAIKYPIANIIAIIIAAAMLLFLFIFPRQYLKDMTDDISALAESALSAAVAESWPKASADVKAAKTRFEAGKDCAKLFLNHEDVDELEALINSAQRLTEVQDAAELVIQLERIQSSAAFMGGIETFDIVDLF